MQEDNQSSFTEEGLHLERPSRSSLGSLSNEMRAYQQSHVMVRQVLSTPTGSHTNSLAGKEADSEAEVNKLQLWLNRQSSSNQSNEVTLKGPHLDIHDSASRTLQNSMPDSASSIPPRLLSATSRSTLYAAKPSDSDKLSLRSSGNSNLVSANLPVKAENDFSAFQKTLEEIQSTIIENESKILQIDGQISEVRSKVLEIQSKIFDEILSGKGVTPTVKYLRNVKSFPDSDSQEGLEASTSEPSARHEGKTSKSTPSSRTARNSGPQTPMKGRNYLSTVATTDSADKSRPDTTSCESNLKQTMSSEESFYLLTPVSSQNTPNMLESPEATPFWDQTPSELRNQNIETPLTPPDESFLSLKASTEREPDSPLASKAERPPARSASQLGAHHPIRDYISAKIESEDDHKKQGSGMESTPVSTALNVESQIAQSSSDPFVSHSASPSPRRESILSSENCANSISAATSSVEVLLSTRVLLEGLYKKPLNDLIISHGGRCMFVTKKGKLCGNRVSHQDGAQGILYNLLALTFPFQLAELSQLIVGLIQTTFCKGQPKHRLMARERILSQARALYTSMDSEEILSRFEDLLSGFFSNPNSGATRLPPTEVMPRVNNDHALGFRPYGVRKSWNSKISEHLKFTVSKPLLPTEVKKGFIYRYWCHVFGFHKIGCTTKDVNVRGMRWEQQCKQKVKMVYPTSFDSKDKLIPHAHRLEKIIFTELRGYRFIQSNCKGCGENHHEWFKSSDSHTKTVFKKWIDWIRQEPYEYIESTNEWRLKSEKTKELDELCQPVDPSQCVLDGSSHLELQTWDPVLTRTSTWNRIEERLHPGN